MRKNLAALALGISLLTLGATVAHAQFGKLLKTLKDAAAEQQVPTNAPVPAQTNVSTATPNCEQLKKSVSRLADDYSSYPEFRAQLIKLGWQPKAQGVLDGFDVMAKDLRKAGFKEVESCAPTGMAPCIYRFVDARGNKLKVVGVGENLEGQVVDNTEMFCSAPTPTPSTLAGRWLPIEYSCTADKGQSDQVIEIVGREQRHSFGVCTYPQVFSNRTAYAGISKCSDEEGGETSYPQSYQIAADGTMAMAIKVNSKVVRTAWKRCSNPLYFVNEEVPSPVKTAATRVTPTNVITLAGRWVPVAESCAGDEGVSERMIEFDGRAMNYAFASCKFPAAISSRSAYEGSMSCFSEGDETNSSVSIAIQQNGTLLWRDSKGSSAYKKCSPAPRFPNE